MPMKLNPQNFLYSDASIQKAIEKIEADISLKHPIKALAQHAGLAEHHFQRRFVAATGETVAGYLRVRRLEKAALALLKNKEPTLAIALQFGYQTHSAFSKAFKIQFGVTPKQFRESSGEIDSKGEHPRPYLIPSNNMDVNANFDLVNLGERWLCWRGFKGLKSGRYFPDLTSLNTALVELKCELGKVMPQGDQLDSVQIVSAFTEGPKSFDDPNALAYAGVIMDAPISLKWSEDWMQLSPQRYAVFPHFGPLLNLPLTWNKVARVALKTNQYQLAREIMYEAYLTSKANDHPSKLTAQIYLPITKAQ